LYYTEEKALGVTICEHFLKDIIDTKKDIIQNLDTILIELVNRIAFDQPTSPHFSEQAITKVLKHLAKSFSRDSVASLLLNPPDKLQKIMIHLQERLVRSHRTAEKRRVIDAFDLIFTREVGVKITQQPLLLRGRSSSLELEDRQLTAPRISDFIHMLLQNTSYPGLVSPLCKILLRVCSYVLPVDCSELRKCLNTVCIFPYFTLVLLSNSQVWYRSYHISLPSQQRVLMRWRCFAS
jgi:hypothetical protein